MNSRTAQKILAEYKLTGNNKTSDSLAKVVVENMSKDAAAAGNDQNIGHYVDRELAYAYLKTNDYNKALDHALAEYNRRPQNIDVNETLAWVYYEKGDFAKALPYIKAALKTNSKNPTLLNRAELIFGKAGDNSLVKKFT